MVSEKVRFYEAHMKQNKLSLAPPGCLESECPPVSPETLRLGHHPWDSGTISCCEPQSGPSGWLVAERLQPRQLPLPPQRGCW